MKKILLLITSLMLVICLAACSVSVNEINNKSTSDEQATSVVAEYSDFDLTDISAISDIQNVDASLDTIKITKKGNYKISGNYNGNIIIDAGEEKVILILDNAAISSSNGAPISVSSADKVLIYLIGNSSIEDNRGKDGDAKGAAIDSESPITINGSGSLTISANYNNGIQSEKNIKVINGSISISSENNGIKAENYILIKSGDIKINSTGDGIKTEKEDSYIIIEDGKIKIESKQDGISSAGILTVLGGDIDIATSGIVSTKNNEFGNDGEFVGRQDFNQKNEINGGEILKKHRDSTGAPSMNDIPPNISDGSGFRDSEQGDKVDGFTSASVSKQGSEDDMVDFSKESESDSSSDVSSKGIKAVSTLTISGGNITIEATDHAIKSDGEIKIDGGSIKIESDSKGVKAASGLVVNGGDIKISKSYEGIESKKKVVINGGNIEITSSDDGINAIEDFTINNGIISITANGDGLDSNSNIYLNGGDVIINGPSNNGNSAIDCGGESGGKTIVNGGTVFATGYSGMQDNFDSDSKQTSIVWSLNKNYSEGVKIRILDSNNNEINSYTSTHGFNTIIYSSENIENGNKYIIEIDGEKTEVTINDKNFSNIIQRAMKIKGN